MSAPRETPVEVPVDVVLGEIAAACEAAAPDAAAAWRPTSGTVALSVPASIPAATLGRLQEALLAIREVQLIDVVTEGKLPDGDGWIVACPTSEAASGAPRDPVPLRAVVPHEPIPPLGAGRDRLAAAAAERRARERDERRRRERREGTAAERLRALETAVQGLSLRDRAVLFPTVEARKTRPPDVRFRWA